MAISREKKEEIVVDLMEKLSSTEVIILTDFRGLSVSELQDLRNRLRESNTQYQIVKNTLTRIALERAGWPIPDDVLVGPTAIALLRDEIAEPTKALTRFARETKILTIKGGILGDRVISADEVENLANLPPRPVLLAQLLGAIQGPAGNLVNTLEAPARELFRTLQAPLAELAMTIQAYADQQ